MSEKFNSTTSTTSTTSMMQFNSLIGEFELVDPTLSNAMFTWSNFRDHPICCRLDRFLFTNDWAMGYQCIRQEVEARIVSDHYPVVLDTSPTRWGPTPFRFENAWLEHKQFSCQFDNWWKETSVTGWEGFKWMRTLQKIKPQIKRWNKEVFGDLRLTEGALNNRLMELDGLEGSANWTEELKREREFLKKDLIDIMVKKEISTRKKLKIRWAKEGDANSRLFHNLLNVRKSKNFIPKIEFDNEEVLTIEDVVREVVHFFGSLFSYEATTFRGFDGMEWE